MEETGVPGEKTIHLRQVPHKPENKEKDKNIYLSKHIYLDDKEVNKHIYLDDKEVNKHIYLDDKEVKKHIYLDDKEVNKHIYLDDKEVNKHVHNLALTSFHKFDHMNEELTRHQTEAL